MRLSFLAATIGRAVGNGQDCTDNLLAGYPGSGDSPCKAGARPSANCRRDLPKRSTGPRCASGAHDSDAYLADWRRGEPVAHARTIRRRRPNAALERGSLPNIYDDRTPCRAGCRKMVRKAWLMETARTPYEPAGVSRVGRARNRYSIRRWAVRNVPVFRASLWRFLPICLPEAASALEGDRLCPCRTADPGGGRTADQGVFCLTAACAANACLSATGNGVSDELSEGFAQRTLWRRTCENGNCEVEPDMPCVWVQAWQGSQTHADSGDTYAGPCKNRSTRALSERIVLVARVGCSGGRARAGAEKNGAMNRGGFGTGRFGRRRLFESRTHLLRGGWSGSCGVANSP